MSMCVLTTSLISNVYKRDAQIVPIHMLISNLRNMQNKLLVCLLLCGIGGEAVSSRIAMSKRTALNDNYKGLVEAFPIPVEIHERDGYKYATFGSVVPIHSCTPEEITLYANKTHHYCDLFSDQILAPLGELAYVRLDENTAEKVFINRSKRILVVSSDGQLAVWRCAPTFESQNRFLAGTPIVNQDGQLVSLVTAKKGNHYAVSNFEGESGYFSTTKPWKMLDIPEGASVYGDRSFSDLDELRAYIRSLPPAEVGPEAQPLPVLHRGASPRVALMAQNGVQISHHYLTGVTTKDIEYL